MGGWKRTADTVYVVAWDDAGIVKAGSSYCQRWRRFVIRGARVVSLREYADVTDCYNAEWLMHTTLRRIFPPAFTGQAEAVAYLGTPGDGWKECYRVAPDHAWEQTVKQSGRHSA